MAIPPFTNWQSDWLYSVILRQAEKAWARCNRDPERDVWKYVLIEECSEAMGARCAGDTVRTWVRDADGLREITLADDERLVAEIEHCSLYPFILMLFHILPDRERVLLGFQEASLSGYGSQYLVRGEGSEATLEHDPSGGFWRS